MSRCVGLYEGSQRCDLRLVACGGDDGPTLLVDCFAELHCIPVEVLAAAADLLNGLAGGHECPAPTLMLLPSMSNFHLMENISGLFSLFSMLELKAEMVSGEV